ncbi:hypothetical protein ETD86_28105 [Nonomuraea turkmeniaca]|uniref:Uncharacterized protein n=1 Tax=Nonomuraea turkmeniaca TaxID=103838 RepID=A0A5S4FB71_9ACTN|nr:hypothetical protein [Nonomuraea turkmeniaca]TMR14911.1 hypothetical protein ETD86_28105 [Nonomuraea turkmeniaca]
MRQLVWPALACALLAGCSADRDCTAIGTPVGLSVHVNGPLAGRATAVSMEVCWDGACKPAHVELMPSTRPGKESCSGDTCSVTAVPDGGKHAFGDVPGLPDRPVRVRLALLDAEGAPVLDRMLDLTPRLRYPNGPACGAGGPNAVLTVEGDGLVTSS